MRAVINEALFGQADERLKKSPLPGILRKHPYKGDGVLPPESADFVSDDNLFHYQAKVIRELAAQESCIIIGRCADYVLREHPSVDSAVLLCAVKRLCGACDESKRPLGKGSSEKN